MTRGTGGVGFNPIRQLFERGTAAGLDDDQLLARFAAARDEAAFDALVARHGPMVWATARAVSRNEQDAEDAFQATFLTLARRADSVRSGATLAAWLHRVAHRSAVEAGVATRRRRDREAEAAMLGGHRVVEPNPEPDLVATVRAEVDRLPDRHRFAVVLCDLEGLTYLEAATRLGWTEPTLRNRLAQARAALKSRLERRGFASAAAPALWGLTPARSVVPEGLARTTVALALGQGTASTTVLMLTQAFARGMLMKQLKLVVAAILAATSLGAITFAAVLPAPAPNGGGETSSPPSPPPRSLAPAPTPAKVADDRVIRGRVLDPTGQPVAGASVAAHRYFTGPKVKPMAMTKADGRFELVVPNEFIKPETSEVPLRVIATAFGFGLNWGYRGNEQAEVEIRLVAEGPPIQGRILDEAGKPVAGVNVDVWSLLRPLSNPLRDELPEDLTRLLAEPTSGWMWRRTEEIPVEITATTGDDGWFSIKAVGPDRIATLKMTGPSIANTIIYAISRIGPVIKFENDPLKGHSPLTFYLSRFELTVKPTRIIEGVVRDAESGKPLTGWGVIGLCQHAPHQYWELKARTDSDGRYRLVGSPPFTSYSIDFQPPVGQSYLGAFFRENDHQAKPGLGPVTFDMDARRAVLLRGRVTDKATGQPIAGQVQWLPFPGTSKAVGYLEYDQNHSVIRANDNDGRYELAVPPGRCLLAFRARNFDRYPTGQGAASLPGFNSHSREIVSKDGPSIDTTGYHILAEVNTFPGADSSTLDLQLGP